MTCLEYMRKRLFSLNGQEFLRKNMIIPGKNCSYTSAQLLNAFKSLVESNEIIHSSDHDYQTKKFIFVGKPQFKGSLKMSKSAWATVYPEFFVAPALYGTCRTYITEA